MFYVHNITLLLKLIREVFSQYCTGHLVILNMLEDFRKWERHCRHFEKYRVWFWW